ncbi:LarC family nickel insertion protein [Pleomorphomonas koreensis]|uniref:LarC family nickel insertion protein n=1 Tax=Pleomorphomonas koreensis TaxID=257440 RepID=UPI00041E38DD|nr:LarC family nickel insertion protein [Pleomorphomonas koreensis]
MTTARRHIHLDTVGGIAGDMFVAAMLDALPELEARVRADLAAVLPVAAGRVELTAGLSGGLAVRRFALVPPDGGIHHHHGHDHGHSHGPEAPVRYGDIVALIEAAPLAPGSAAAALAILRRLGEAESRVHGVPLAAVHFHEIADWDSLADVVAAGSIAAALEETSWSVSDLPRGGGRIRTRHGLMPVPAPATALLLEGFLLIDDGVPGERVTPTGAAILAHLVDPEARPPAGARLVASGLGAGTRDLPEMPNVVRAMVHDLAARPAAGDVVAIVAFDVDDMTGEEIGHAAERLRAAAGVLDLALSHQFGKKSRPLTAFRLLVEPACLDAVLDLCLVETSTIGVRWHEARRRVLPRRATLVDGPDGQLRLKSVVRPDGSVTVKVEADDVGGLGGLAARRRAARTAEGHDDG